MQSCMQATSPLQPALQLLRAVTFAIASETPSAVTWLLAMITKPRTRHCRKVARKAIFFLKSLVEVNQAIK